MSDLEAHVVVRERGVDVALEVPSGSTTAIVGPNGAGKSTVLDVVAGLVAPSTGDVRLGGRRLLGLPPHRRRVSLLAQQAALFPHLSVLENVAFGPRAQGVRRGEARDTARRWLERVGVAPLADRRPDAVSGGQAQRVGIARALAAGPELLLLDEPTAALDVGVAPLVRDVLRRVTTGTTTVVVTHSLEDALVLADHVVVLQDGRVVDHGAVEAVLGRPTNEFVAGLAGQNVVVGRWDGSAVVREHWSLHSTVPVEAEAGDDVIGVFQPSSVRLVTPATGAGARCLGTVVALARIGDRTRVHVTAAGGAISVEAHLTTDTVTDLDLRPGATVEVQADPHRVEVHRQRPGRSSTSPPQ